MTRARRSPELSRRAFLATGGAVAAAALAARVSAAPRGAETELPRRVLALYKSYETYAGTEGARPKTPTLNEVHQWAQMPLNWLGLMVEYHDLARGLPDAAAMARYRGVVTWYQTDDVDDPLGYARWLTKQIEAGRRVVILGTLGAFRERQTGTIPDLEAISRALAPTGLEFAGQWTTDQRLIELRFKDPRIMEFERKLPAGLPNYNRVVSRRADNRVHLVLARRDLPQSESHMVVTGPWGGYAGNSYVRFQSTLPVQRLTETLATATLDVASISQELYGSQWLIDPFRFFEEALGIAGWPRPDVTTLNGRRIVYCHIDGDGMRNPSEVRRGALSGEVVLDDVLSRYPLPTTVSVVVAEVDPKLLGSPRTHALARALLALPHVEAASHSYFHPLDWERKTRSFDLPGHPYSVEEETASSIRYVDEHLLPPGKRVRVFQWSGSTRVTEEAVAVLDRLGIPNINGGDSVRDGKWPSYTRVSPLMRQVGAHWQVYTSASNENLYTNLWTGPFYGFRYVVETFERTETPRRVSAINVYYHFYSGERVASLKALTAVYDWVLRRPLAPLFTSEYLAMVAGFRSARIARTAEGWRIWNHGDLRTVRFDGSDEAVDLRASRGVLGWNRHAGSLYVHLEGSEEALVVLTAKRSDVPYLVSASHRVTRFHRQGGGVVIRLAGLGPRSVEVGGFPPDRQVGVEIDDAGTLRRERVRADAAGVVAVNAGTADVVAIKPA